MSELVPAYLHLPYRQVHLMPDVVEAHLLVEPYLPSSETIIVLFTIDYVVLLLPCVDYLPKAKFLGRSLVLRPLQEDLRSDRLYTSSVFLHLLIVFDSS